MKQPRKSWARIDSTMQRNLGHKKYYEIPFENLPGTLVGNDILRFPDSDANPNVPEHMILRYHEPDSRPQAPETLILQHHDLVSRPQAPELLTQQYPELRNNPNSIGYPGYKLTREGISRLLSDIKQYPPREVQSGPQPITTFGEGFRQSLDQWKNNYSYLYGKLMKNMNHEEEIRNGLMALDENPELSRGNVQEINRSIKALRRGIAEYRRRIEAGEGTPEDEAAILKDSEKIRGLYAMQQQYYKGATPEEAEAWRNNYIAQGGTGMQLITETRENQKNYRPTERWGTVGYMSGEIPKTLVTAIATRNPYTAPLAIGSIIGDAIAQNLAQSNMLADQIEEQTGKEVSNGRRLVQTGIGSAIDAITSLFVPGHMTKFQQNPVTALIKNGFSQGIVNGTNSMIHNFGSNLTLGNNLSNKEILSDAGKNFLIGAATGAGASAIGHTINKVSKTGDTFRKIPDEAGMKSFSIDNTPIQVERGTLSSSIRNALEKEGLHIDNTPTTIPFDTYRRKQLAPPGTYVRPYQNPGKIDPNGLRMIPREEVQDNMTIPMNRYQLSYPLPEGMSNGPITIPHGRYGSGSSFWGDNFRLSYPLPEGMSNEPITIPQGRYGHGSSFWGDNFRLSYPLPDDWDNSPVTIPFNTYRRKQLAPPGTYVRPYQNPGKIDPNGLRMIPREEIQDNMTIPMDRYQLSYPLPEGMSNEPITIPQGRYGHGSSFWGDNFRLSYPLPDDWDNSPVTIPFNTYRRKQLAPPGTYVRPYQNPGKIDPNGLRMIPRDEVQDNMTIPMDRYQLSYPLPEGMSNEPITIPQGRYGRGSSFWGDNFRLSYPLPDDWDNSPVTIPFDTYRRKQLAPPGTYVRPYQNPGKIDPNGLRMIPRDEVQDNMTIPMDRYQLSYPLPEGMSNDPITIPQGRYGHGSSFWGDNFRLSYPLPDDWDNSPVTIPFNTYRRKQLAPPGTYVRPYQNPGKIDPNGLRMIPREEAQDYMSIPMNRYQFSYPLPDDWDNSPVTIPFDTYRRKQLAPPGTYVRPYQNPGKIDPNGLRMIPRDELQENMTAPGSMGREPQAGASSSDANDTATPFKAYEDMFGIDKLDDNDKKAKTPRGRKKRKK